MAIPDYQPELTINSVNFHTLVSIDTNYMKDRGKILTFFG